MLSWPVITVMCSWAVGCVRLEHFGNCHFLHHMVHNSKSILVPGHQHPLRQQTVQGQALEEDRWLDTEIQKLGNESFFVRRDAVLI